MYGMTPQLATAEDVNIAANAVKECESKISNKEAELADARINVSNLEATINALKSKL
jgi:hypothetical protein